MSTLNYLEDNSLFSNAFGFLRQPLVFEPYKSDAQVVITGVPFDMATSGRSGSRFGPAAIRQISVQLAWEHQRYPWDFDVRDKLKIIDCGDLVYASGDSEQMCKRLSEHIEKLVKLQKLVVNLGGDHFITLPVLRGLHQALGKKLSIIHFDAHSDTYEVGSRCDHGTMFYHAVKEGLIDPAHSVQVGIRTEYDKNLAFTVLDGNKIQEMSLVDVISKIKDVVAGNEVHVTFDIDCLDPAFAPGTGTPVCGGLSSYQALKILRGLIGEKIVGFDMVEVAPSYDRSEITALAAATLTLEMLYVKAASL